MSTAQWEITTPGELSACELARWESLRSSGPSLESPFLSGAFATHVGAVRRDARVAVHRAHGSHGIAGFLPFHSGPTRLGRPVGRRLSDAHGAVVDPTLEWDPRAVVRRSGLRALTFDHLVEGQTALAPYVTATSVSPQIDLSDGFPAYLAAARQEGRGGPRGAARQRRRLEKDHELRFTWNDRDPGALRTLISWKSDQYRRTGAFDQMQRPWVPELLERLHASDHPACAGILSTLHVGDELVAIDFALRSGGHLASWFPAYDPSWSSYSPGGVLLLETARAAADEGVRTLDLGKGDESYKQRWATDATQLATATIVADSPTAAGLTVAGRVAWAVARRTRLREWSERLHWQLDVG